VVAKSNERESFENTSRRAGETEVKGIDGGVAWREKFLRRLRGWPIRYWTLGAGMGLELNLECVKNEEIQLGKESRKDFKGGNPPAFKRQEPADHRPCELEKICPGSATLKNKYIGLVSWKKSGEKPVSKIE